MVDKNRNLLDEVIRNHLEKVLDPDTDPAVRDTIFKQAMEAVDRDIELSKFYATCEEQVQKQELTKSEAKKDRWIRVIEIFAAAILTPIIAHFCNKGLAKVLCEFEKDYTFTTSAGKALSKMFKFR